MTARNEDSSCGLFVLVESVVKSYIRGDAAKTALDALFYKT
jgi:hypothetical protein